MNTANAAVPLRPFAKRQTLCLPTDCQSGLILQYQHYTSFAGVGAAVGCGCDVDCLSIFPIGKVCFSAPETHQQRQQALQQRILYAETLCKIASVHSPFQRAYLIIRQLCLWLNPRDVQLIPHGLISQLIGVSPKHIEIGWQKYLQHCNVQGSRSSSASNSIAPKRSYSRENNVEVVQVSVTMS